ncbi:MAG: trigger factor [Rickettsiales bacterium]|nr:trigger factor [Rickettsiales bacterium]
MKIEEKKNKGLDIEWVLTIPSKKIDSHLDEKFKEISKNVKIPGFRPGKVPIDVIKKRYSKSVIPDILDKVVNESLTKAVSEKKIRPAVQPNVNIENFEEGKDLVLKVNFQKMPEVSELDITKIKLEKSKLDINENDIKNTLEDVAKKHERFSPLEKPRKSIKGDLILFDYIGKIDGKDFENNSGKDETVVLGSNKYIPGYEEQMIGLEINDSKTINVTFPDDYRLKSIAGKKAKFELNIKDIQQRVKKIPIDEKLAKELGEENLEKLKVKIREKMQIDFKKLSDLKMRRQASEELIKKCKFEIPSQMIAQESDFLKKQSKEKKDKEIEEIAVRRVKLGILITSIAEKHKISLEDSDLTKAVSAEASRYPGQEKEVVEFYKNNPAMLNNLRGVALEEKVMNYVVNSCKKIEKKCTMDQLFESDFLKQEKPVKKSKKERAI